MVEDGRFEDKMMALACAGFANRRVEQTERTELRMRSVRNGIAARRFAAASVHLAQLRGRLAAFPLVSQ